jgi:transcriptional regulator with XRE-family HTH domain
MKTIGEQVKEFRLDKGWNTTAMAKAVGTSRQNIESLEAAGNRQPRYLKKLSLVMGLTTDALINGCYASPTLAAQSPPPADNLPISGQKQLLASESIASGAIDINANRRGPLAPQDVVVALGALLAGVQSERSASVAGLLADFARSPGDAWLADMLTKALEPEAFTQQGQRHAGQ